MRNECLENSINDSDKISRRCVTSKRKVNCDAPRLIEAIHNTLTDKRNGR